MGTRALDPASWLLFDGERDAQLARKAQLIADERAIVFGALPDSEDASAEALELVDGVLSARGLTSDRPIDDHPLVQAASAIQEDLVVLQRIDGSWVLTAGGVCFPTHWGGADKLGLLLGGLPQPPAPHRGGVEKRGGRL